MNIKQKKSVFNFNHIDKSNDKNQITEIKALYYYYHMLYWCYKSQYKKLKRINISLILLSNGLIAASAISVISANPIIIASLSVSGITLNVFLKKKKFDEKIVMFKFASVEYKKTLIFLRTSLRDKNIYNHHDFILKMEQIDNIITDLVPYINDKIKTKYAKKFNI